MLSVAKDHGKISVNVCERGGRLYKSDRSEIVWTAEDGFRTSWDKAFRKTSLKDLHFHDLRGTAVTRLALSNCSVPEIASITGHSMKTVQEILDAHYLGGRLELAESAIKKLSAVYGQAQK